MSTELTPSQVVNDTNPGRGSRRRRRRTGHRGAANTAAATTPSGTTPTTTTSGHENTSNTSPLQPEEKPSAKVTQDSEIQSKTNVGNKNKGRKGKAIAAVSTGNETNPDSTNAQEQIKKNKSPKKRRNRKKPQSLWKKFLPDDSVDPITLDPLSSLKYPPFALVAEEPHTPVDWPFSSNEAGKEKPTIETAEERQARILQEQWGSIQKATPSQTPPKEVKSPKDRHVNLFDGRALAYYMVSQLQFIDPLNRRDLTRDEIVHLDHYLRRHGFFDINVAEAYDAKGITISTAGATAQTASGRAAILQQEARHLLNALFGSRHHLPAPTSRQGVAAAPNSFAQEYLEHEATRTQRSRARTVSPHEAEETGIYGAGTGYVIIDDDMNPGLRSGNFQQHPQSQLRASVEPFTPAQNVLFPPLDAVQNKKAGAEEETKPPQAANLPKAKTLSKIGSLVRKTDPREQQRQWEAREAAIRKAALVNRSFNNANPVGSTIPSLPPVITTAKTVEPTQGQIQRNMAFASALGVTPTTARVYGRQGWSRPSGGTDEFGNELAMTIYPESLVQRARDLKPGLLTKVERKWKAFLEDDTSASLPLNPMDRPTRTVIHEYSDFWKLHTESFDPEPKRYIHCVKLADTCAPTPLLSKVLYTPQQQPIDKPFEQSAGQMSGREMPQPTTRLPLELKPKSDEAKMSSAPPGLSIGGKPSLTMAEEEVNERFEALSIGRERPKLELAKRTLPLELPAFKPLEDDEKLERLRKKNHQMQTRKEEEMQRAQKLLEAAFASDDENEASARSDESEWEEQAPAFVGSDEE